MTRSPNPILHPLPLALAAVILAVSAPARAYTVATASHDVTVDCGTSGTDVPTDWYFPQPNPNLGLVWLQHGFSRTNNQMIDLATEIASRGYVVFATSLAPGATGCAMNNAGFLSDFARLFPEIADPDTGLLQSARAAALSAGVPLSTLPADFAFSGHSAGGASVLAVARNLVVDHPAAAAGLRGVALLDPVESTSGALIATALPALATLPVYTVSSPPYSCNSNASGTVLLAASGRPFAGVRLASGSHCDAEGDSTDFLCTAFCGTPQPANVAALQTLVTGWLDDFFADDFTPDWYPSGAWFESQVASGRIVALPSPSTCGNGALDAGEACDDGNRANGDCCNAICGAEPAGGACASDGNVCTVDACDGSGACGHAAGNAGTLCRAASGVCDVAETCDGASPTCPTNGFAADGTACPADTNPCTRDQCDGSGTCAHPPGNAGTVCRAASGACDVAETCDGVSSGCPADDGLPDGDADGTCDALDACTNPADGQDFLVHPKPSLVLTRVLTDATPGNDGLVLRADFRLGAGATFAALDPSLDGARVLLANAAGTLRLDATLPPGSYAGNGTRGWLRTATRWKYLDRTVTPIAGITGFDVTDRATAAAGQVKMKITGKRGTYPLAIGDAPLAATVLLGGAAASGDGRCGESAFRPGDCIVNGSTTTMRCTR
ncbi:MAG: hypothetical protein FJ148_21355 [Deltaproteobacteria bacterium]|nr:hypothetical protein [Deltaproteobacteria bacterium]